VVLDTNAWFWPFTHGVALDAEFDRLVGEGVRMLVAEATLAELDALVVRGVVGAEPARRLAGRAPVVPTRARGDAAVLEAARSRGALLATSDRGLAARARAAGVGVIGPRDRARLELRRGARPAARAMVKSRSPVARRRSTER
jgi:rRNA-processing protein FCF1